MKKKKLPIYALIATALLLVSPFIRPVYQRLMAWRLLHAAESAAKKGEPKEADHLYRLALQRNATNRAILHSYADFLNRQHSPVLLQVRERLRQLDPENAAVFFDCVEAALTFQEPQEARSLLTRRAPASARESARFFHYLSVSHFLASEFPQADVAATEAVKRDRENKVYLADQACIRLCCLDPNVLEKARATLLAYLTDPDERNTALHSLLLDAAQIPTDKEEPIWVARILDEARASILPNYSFFPDYLSALRRWRPDEFGPNLAEYLKAAAEQPPTALFAERWLVGHRLYQEDLDFRASLPEAFQDSRESVLLAAEALFQLAELDKLTSFLHEPVWAHYPAFELAWAERLRRDEKSTANDERARQLAWRRILTTAGASDSLSTLSHLTFGWRWSHEHEDALWLLSVGQSRLSLNALRELARYYLNIGDAAGLLRVLKRQMALDPGDPVAANNFAYASFLLGREFMTATKCVDDLCARYPDSPGFAATRAFGLFRRGDTAAALDALARFAPEHLRGTPQGVTYGLVLASIGDPHARAFLQDANHWAHFPEERQLIAESTAKTDR